MDTLPETVPAEEPASHDAPAFPPPMVDERRRHAKKWWILGTLIGLFVVVPGAVIGWAAATTVDYYTISPGSATWTQPLISSDKAKLYDAEGRIFYTTVTQKQMSRLEKFRYDHRDTFGWDKRVIVLTREQLFGKKDPNADQAENVRVMGYTKEFASYVALHRLGYDVKVSHGGVVVTSIVDGVPAAKVLKKGDVITSLDGQPVQVGDDLRAIIATHKPGEVVDAQVTDNDGKGARTVKIEFAQREGGGAFIGITTGVPPTIEFAFPFSLDIETGDVGGPSAGLAFTLATLDVLTPGELTGGKKVAVTGTIDLEGNVGQIGGIQQKEGAVEAAGADVFLVPTEEAKDAIAVRSKNSKLKIIGVETLDDAIHQLALLGGNAEKLGTPGKA